MHNGSSLECYSGWCSQRVRWRDKAKLLKQRHDPKTPVIQRERQIVLVVEKKQYKSSIKEQGKGKKTTAERASLIHTLCASDLFVFSIIPRRLASLFFSFFSYMLEK